MRSRCLLAVARGFTIVELVVVMVVLSIIFVSGGVLLKYAFESYDLAGKTTDVDWQGRVAMERMVRELREIRSATSTDLSFGTSPTTSISFNDMDGNAVCYTLSGTTLLRGESAPSAGSCSASTQVLADNIPTGGFNLYYYTRKGTAPASVEQVYQIAVTLSVSETSGGNTISEDYRVTVQPRSF